MTYSEITLRSVPAGPSEVDPAGYLSLNADVAAAGMDAVDHFTRHGQAEGRAQYQLSAIAACRAEKLARVFFKEAPDEPRSLEEPQNYLTADQRAGMDIPDQPPVAENDYNAEVVEMIRAQPEELLLDVGAGLRHTYYSNVVNAEIWASATTDVVCIGEELPFADAQFDGIICLAVLEHTRRPWLAVREIIRVAKPGALIRIDWPFLQPVHGYPHHYFNATPEAAAAEFAADCDILSSEIKLWQHPIFAMTWIAKEWFAGLPDELRQEFERVPMTDLIHGNVEALVREPFCSALSETVQRIIACGTTIVARKR